MPSSIFAAVEMAPRDPILGLNESFNADTRSTKVNLGVGVYFDDNGKIPLLGAVKIAEDARVATDAPVDLTLALIYSVLTVIVFFQVLANLGGTITVLVAVGLGHGGDRDGSRGQGEGGDEKLLHHRTSP